MMHAFYAIMGGFAMDTPRDQPFLPDGRTRRVLTGRGFKGLIKLRPQLYPAISETYIVDKSKASVLAKTIVCIQASWFLSKLRNPDGGISSNQLTRGKLYITPRFLPLADSYS